MKSNQDDPKQPAVDRFMDALGQLFSAGISEQPKAVAVAVRQGLEKGNVKLQCSVGRMSGHEIQLFEIKGGSEKFNYGLVGKDQNWGSEGDGEEEGWAKDSVRSADRKPPREVEESLMGVWGVNFLEPLSSGPLAGRTHVGTYPVDPKNVDE